MSAVESFVSTARAELGTAEDPPGSNRCKYTAWYGLTGAWCGMYVSWVADRAGVTDVVPRFAYTPAGADWFAQRGMFSRSPVVGDVAFYDVSGMGRISHCGIVEAVLPDGRWLSLEGNSNSGGSRTGGAVVRNVRSTVGTSRGGFGRPRWSWSPPSTSDTAGRAVLRRGSSGTAVRALQEALNRFLRQQNAPPLVVDGAFGAATLAAVLRFQRERNLSPDGVVGPRTWAALA